MEKKEKKGGAVAKFFKKNIYYILLIASLLAIGTIITLALTLNKAPKDPYIPSDTPPIEMRIPVESEYTLINDYIADKHIWFSTIKHYKTHSALDFGAPEGTEVLAVLDGTVTEVSSDRLNGTFVTIQHSEELTTVYKSLSSEVNVQKGDTVKRGDIIGTISASMGMEKDLGPHLHFEVQVNGKNVNPNEYLTLSEDK